MEKEQQETMDIAYNLKKPSKKPSQQQKSDSQSPPRPQPKEKKNNKNTIPANRSIHSSPTTTTRKYPSPPPFPNITFPVPRINPQDFLLISFGNQRTNTITCIIHKETEQVSLKWHSTSFHRTLLLRWHIRPIYIRSSSEKKIKPANQF